MIMAQNLASEQRINGRLREQLMHLGVDVANHRKWDAMDKSITRHAGRHSLQPVTGDLSYRLEVEKRENEQLRKILRDGKTKQAGSQGTMLPVSSGSSGSQTARPSSSHESDTVRSRRGHLTERASIPVRPYERAGGDTVRSEEPSPFKSVSPRPPYLAADAYPWRSTQGSYRYDTSPSRRADLAYPGGTSTSPQYHSSYTTSMSPRYHSSYILPHNTAGAQRNEPLYPEYDESRGFEAPPYRILPTSHYYEDLPSRYSERYHRDYNERDFVHVRRPYSPTTMEYDRNNMQYSQTPRHHSFQEPPQVPNHISYYSYNPRRYDDYSDRTFNHGTPRRYDDYSDRTDHSGTHRQHTATSYRNRPSYQY